MRNQFIPEKLYHRILRSAPIACVDIAVVAGGAAASPNRSNWRGSPVHFVRTNRVTR